MASKAAVLSASSSFAARWRRLGIPAGENQPGSLSARSSCRFEPDAGATADHDDGLPEEFWFALNGKDGKVVAVLMIPPRIRDREPRLPAANDARSRANLYSGTRSRAPSMWSVASAAASSGLLPFSRATM